MKLLEYLVCGNIVEMIEGKGAPIMCCGKLMDELKADTTDGTLEEHVPAAEIADRNLHVKVGFMEHPTLAKYYITMILVEAGDNIMHRSLKPGEKPEGILPLGDYKEKVYVYEYCNPHGLWKTGTETQPIQNKEHRIVPLSLSLCIDKESIT